MIQYEDQEFSVDVDITKNKHTGLYDVSFQEWHRGTTYIAEGDTLDIAMMKLKQFLRAGAPRED